MGKATFHSKYLEIKCKIKEFHLQSFFDRPHSPLCHHHHQNLSKATFDSKYLEIECKIKEFHLQSFFGGPPVLYHLQTSLFAT